MVAVNSGASLPQRHTEADVSLELTHDDLTRKAHDFMVRLYGPPPELHGSMCDEWYSDLGLLLGFVDSVFAKH